MKKATNDKKIMGVYLEKKVHAEITQYSKQSGMSIKAFASILMLDGLSRLKRGEVVIKRAEIVKKAL